ncbi:MAG: Mrp/NBP35 family ATP-binding protein [Oscillospiraceae bacterium]|nr:Mrp/NBP35 family ATP-binding protein [Oscillospiraceae bacterium]
MSECTHNCSSCSENCSERSQESLIASLNRFSSVKKVIGVVSGKGGVGKSSVTALLATAMSKKGYKTAVLDADITGPSIPKAFGITEKPKGTEEYIIPCKSKGGIDIMSVGLLLENETDPVLWRGPIIAGTVKQFWTDVIWNEVDYMFVDMPPGTGDVPLTVFQSIPLDGIVVVSTPQKLVGVIVEKAIKMAEVMNIPVLGIIENMSYVLCPDCGKKIDLFGESGNEKILDRLPLDPRLADHCDNGTVEDFTGATPENTIEKILSL